VGEGEGEGYKCIVYFETVNKTVDVSLQEHVIISDDGFYSYRKNGYFEID